VIKNVKEDFNTYMGQVYEEIVKQCIRRLKLPFKPLKVGGWWKKGVEIDVVALDRKEKKAVLLEVKWKNINRKEAYKILAELEEKGKELPYPTKYYGLVGLDIDSREDLEKDGYLVYELKDLVKPNTYSVNLPK